MTYIETEIPGVWIIEPKVFKDARGYFMEAWKKAEFEEHIGKVEFVQDNESCSSKGVLTRIALPVGSLLAVQVGTRDKRMCFGCGRRFA